MAGISTDEVFRGAFRSVDLQGNRYVRALSDVRCSGGVQSNGTL